MIKWNTLNINFYDASDFELKFLRRVRFWIKIFTTRQIVKYNFYDASDFELKFLRRVRLWIIIFTTLQILKNKFSKSMILKKKLFLNSTILKKKFAQKKSRFVSFYHVKCADFEFYVHFWKARFWRKNFF